MVSILPMVDLLGNTAVDLFCILSYFRLDTLPLGSTISFFLYYSFMWSVRDKRIDSLACVLSMELSPLDKQ